MNKALVARKLLILAKNLLADEPSMLFNIDNASEIINKFKTHIHAAFVNGSVMSLGRDDKATIYLTISLDPKDKWSNGIIENSRYFKLSLQRNGEMELFSGGTRKLRFRKTKAKNIDDAILKLNKYCDEVVKFESFF